MRFDMTFWPGSGSSRDDAADGSSQEIKRMADGRQDIANKYQHTRQHTQHGRSGITPVALTFDAVLRLLWRIAAQCTCTKQRSQVVSQHLGGNINDQSLLTQARDGLQLHVVLEPLERLLNTPALMIEFTKTLPREICAVQIRGHHTHLCIGGNIANQAYLRRVGRTMTQSLSQFSAGMCKCERALANARSDTLRTNSAPLLPTLA